MEIQKHSCQRIAAAVFFISTIGSIYFFNQLQYSNILAVSAALFIGIITTGVWIEAGYRFLVKQATAPLDKLIEKL